MEGGGRSISNHKGVKAAERHPKILHITSQRREGKRDEGNRGGTEGGKAGGVMPEVEASIVLASE